MHCFYHRDVEAVATCKSCGRGLCPDCAHDVGNGLACMNRCEAEVVALNRIIARNKTAYEKTSGAYTRTALFYAAVGAVFLAGGLANWRGFGWVLVPAAVIFFLSAYVHYSTGRRFRGE
jgi:hypothetical protein